MDKKKIITAVVAAVAVIAIAISVILLTKNTKTIHTVSFSLNNGEYVFNQEIQDGKTASKPNSPNKEGYIFLGWYIGNEEYDFSKPVKENLTLEAKWEEIIEDEIISDNEEIVEEEKEDEKEEEKEEEEKVIKYTVKFDSDGGSKVSSKTVEKNKTVKQPANPTKDGYKFLGWYLGNTKYNFSNKVTKNITLKAKWEKVEEKPSQPETPVTPEVKEYTVKFDVDGKITTQTVKEGNKVLKPSNPTKEGYTFKYWSLNGSEYNFLSEVKGDITLKAEWKKNDVIDTEVVTVSSIGALEQVKIYVRLNGNRVAGTVDITYVGGVTETVNIPAGGYFEVKSAYTKISNPKVK